MRIAVASDHAGFKYKTSIVDHLCRAGHDVTDCGTFSPVSVDYPDFIRLAAEAVVAGRCERGVVLGGSGNGEAMASNRYRGIRCAVCWNEETATLARSHNDANMISLGERMMTEAMALRIVDVWIETPFEGGRHLARIQKLDQLG